MSQRLNQEREAALQPLRVAHAAKKLRELGFEVTVHEGNSGTPITFDFKGATVTFWPYSGWASGKTIKDGRGLKNLIKQLNETKL